MLDINDRNNQGFTGFEPALLLSAENLKQKPFGHGNTSENETTEYKDTRSSDVTTVQKIMNKL